MDDYKPLAVFAETVDAGSMSAAARRLGMSPSAVSQTLRALEAQNSVVLLHRSTRKLTLTAAGERYYPHCRRLLDAARAASESLERTRAEPVGELRVAAPVGFANHIPPALAPLLADAPQLRLRLLLDDAMIDLIEARIDLAVRVGRLDDSQWIARRLGELRTVLCASPEYLARHGVPQTPLALQKHQWIASERGQRLPQPAPGRRARDAAPAVSSQAVVMPLELRDAGNRRHVLDVEARVASNNQIALQAMCEHGLGIARLAHADVLPSLQRGALVQVLPDWDLPSMPVWAVTPRRDGDDAKVRGAWVQLKRYFGALSGTGRS